MLAIGRGALGTVDGRLRWIEADLASPDWLEALGETQVDAVLSTTALHWLAPEPLARLYQDLARLLRPGGLLLNGDHMAFSRVADLGASEPAGPRRAVDGRRLRRPRHRDGGAVVGCVGLEPALAPLLAERPGASPASSGRSTARLRRPRGGAARRRLPRGGNHLAGALESRAAGRALSHSAGRREALR